MAIKDLQQQQAQVGRIRLGHQVPTGNGTKTRPEKLDKFRFTTPSRPLADAVAARYGGAVSRWEPANAPAEWEVVSDADRIPVLVPPRPVTQWYEMWSGSGCQRRCDGETETLSGDPCKCPLDPIARADEAAKGKACKATTRLKVMLPEIPGLGVWRLDSHGYYSAIELPQTAEFLGAVTDSGGYVKATLALEPRSVKRPGQGLRSWYVPVLHVDVTPDELMAGAGTVLPGRATTAITEGTAAANGNGNGTTRALPAGEVDRDAAAQAIADQVPDAADADAVRALWTEADREKLLDVDVADPGGLLGPLRTMLTDRGQALAQVGEPAGDVDALWQQVVEAAADQPHGFDVDLDFAEWSDGKTPAEADAQLLGDYLTRLRSRVGA